MTNSKLAIISLAFAIIVYAIFLFGGGSPQLLPSLQKIGGAGIFLILSMSFFNYGLRFSRWHLYSLRLGHEVPQLLGFEYYVAGFSLTATPGKIGEAIRGLYLKQHQVPYTHSLSMLFAERLSDLLAMVLLSCLALWQLPQYRSFIAIVICAILALLLLLQRPLALNWLQRQLTRTGLVKVNKLTNKLFLLVASARQLLARTVLLSGLALGLCSWAAEGFGFYLVLQFLHVDISPALAIGVYAISILIGALSFLPGGLGSTEAVMVLMLVFLGVPQGEALVATLICRAATLWFAVLIGILAMLDLQHRAPAAKLPG